MKAYDEDFSAMENIPYKILNKYISAKNFRSPNQTAAIERQTQFFSLYV